MPLEIVSILVGFATIIAPNASTELPFDYEDIGGGEHYKSTIVAGTATNTLNSRPLISHGTPYNKARSVLVAAGWYPFKTGGLLSSGVYIDPAIARKASSSYKQFLLDQRREAASWFYNRGMMEIIDCHPQTGQCSALFTNGFNQEAVITTRSGRETRGVPLVERVDFGKAKNR